MEDFIQMFPQEGGINAVMSLEARIKANDENERLWLARARHSSNKTAPAPAPPPSPDTTPPTIPVWNAAVIVSDTQIDLSWQPSTDNVTVASYKLYRDAVQIGGTIAGTSYSDTGLTGGTGYTYTVRAVDTSANESPLSVGQLNTTLPTVQTLSFGTISPGVPGDIVNIDPFNGFYFGSDFRIAQTPSEPAPGLANLLAFTPDTKVGTQEFNDFRMASGGTPGGVPYPGVVFNLISLDYVNGNHDNSTITFTGHDVNGVETHSLVVPDVDHDNPQTITLNFNGIYELKASFTVIGDLAPGGVSPAHTYHGVANIKYTL